MERETTLRSTSHGANIYTHRDDGSIVVRDEIPHSITEWVASAVCTNARTGLGVSAPSTIKAFQPFFASFTLPYSVVRGETVPVKVTVFNYLDDCLVVRSAVHILFAFTIESADMKRIDQ